MLEYTAPQRDFEFLLFELFHVENHWRDVPAFADFGEDLAKAVLAEGGKLAAQVMAPVNQSGDEQGCHWQNGEVTTPEGFKAAYQEIAQGGWLGLSGSPEFEGQGMPEPSTTARVIERGGAGRYGSAGLHFPGPGTQKRP